MINEAQFTYFHYRMDASGFLLLVVFLAFYLAWNLGANDVANAMGTSVGSKAITLQQALILAGLLEFAGAVLFGQQVSQKLATGILNPTRFVEMPQVFLVGMVAVLASSGLWLNLATARGWPVSSSHATVGAIAGVGWAAMGYHTLHWSALGLISVTWMLTPLISGIFAALVYGLVNHWVLQHPQPERQFQEWAPWLSTLLLAVVGGSALPALNPKLQSLLAYLRVDLPAHDVVLFLGGFAIWGLTVSSWQGTKGNPATWLEQKMARFQVVSASFVAFAHGSNDVGNAVAPLAAIMYVQQHQTVPIEDFNVPLWVLVLGGAGIVTGLAIWGHKVIKTIGEGIIPLQPSAGFCAELATAATVLLASRWGLPVSTSHALVGSVVGIGVLRHYQDPKQSIQFSVLLGILQAWLFTIPAAIGLGAGLFLILRDLLAITP